MSNPSIFFWKPNRFYGEFSNFYKSYFKDLEENHYCCVEQFFMYQKCRLFDSTNNILMQKIMNSTDPKHIKKLGRQVKNFDEDIWNEHKTKIMYDGLFLKFTQNEQLKKVLLNTGTKKIYEASPYDKIWGIGLNYHNTIKLNPTEYPGENLLGILLMELRENLKK